MGILQLIGAAVPWRAIGLGAGALAICGAVLLYFAQSKRIEQLDEERTAAVASAAANAQLLQIQSAENVRIRAVLADATKAKISVRKSSEIQRRNIFNAPPVDDGSLAPILRRQLDELPERTSDNVYSGSPPINSAGTPDAK